MSQPELEEAQLLLRKAKEDADAVRKFAADRDIADSVVGFHAQQAVEKAMKAVLTSRLDAFPWTHDLRHLIERLDAIDVSLPGALSDVRVLAPWAVEFRYGETIEDSLNREQAVALAEAVIAWASSELQAPVALTVYEKPTCTTCRKLRTLLVERGVDFDSVHYHITGIEDAELRELLRKLGTGPREILRTREPLVKELGLDAPEVSDEHLIAQMVAHPQLVQRPIVVRGERAVLARPVERALELL